MITAQPANASTASSRARRVSTSRSLVGSSSSSRFPLSLRVMASWRRLRSPPERSPTFFCWLAPLNWNQPRYCRTLTSFPETPSSISSYPLLMASKTVLSSSSPSRSWVTYMSFTVSPTLTVPLSGVSSPAIMRNSVDFPQPLGPITPTMPPRGSDSDRSSYRRRSPKPLDTPSISTTWSPSLGPTGTYSCAAPDRFSIA
mmetsp:Transcript_45298/g.107422  ORF Transcript_45298/g.107422 Transcript_45298/m.107422 type:complete len:200 (+) Transcript_45298:283-882(+)